MSHDGPHHAGQLLTPAPKQLLVLSHIEDERRRSPSGRPINALIPCLIRTTERHARQADLIATTFTSNRIATVLRSPRGGGKTKALADLAKLDEAQATTEAGDERARALNRTCHVMVKGNTKPLCGRPIPDAYELHGYAEDEWAELMHQNSAEVFPWKRLLWCGTCTLTGRWLTGKAAA